MPSRPARACSHAYVPPCPAVACHMLCARRTRSCPRCGSVSWRLRRAQSSSRLWMRCCGCTCHRSRPSLRCSCVAPCTSAPLRRAPSLGATPPRALVPRGHPARVRQPAAARSHQALLYVSKYCACRYSPWPPSDISAVMQQVDRRMLTAPELTGELLTAVSAMAAGAPSSMPPTALLRLWTRRAQWSP
jgi:hypothetical protein